MRIAFAFSVMHGCALSSWELLAFQTKDGSRFFKKRRFRMRVARKNDRSSARRASLGAYLATGVGARNILPLVEGVLVILFQEARF
jgi:hypothetical protein